MKASRALAVVATLALVGTAGSALAWQTPEEKTSLGWLAENAERVVIGAVVSADAVPERPELVRAEVRVEERLKGPDPSPAVVRVLWPAHEGPSVAAGERWTLNLRRIPAERMPEGIEGAHFAVLGGPFGGEKVTEENGRELESWLREHLASTDAEAEPTALTRHLIRGMASKHRRIAISSGLDFSRIERARAGLTEDDVAAVADAFRRAPFGDGRKAVLATALGATGDAAAADPLVDAILSGRGRAVRVPVGKALARIGTDAAVEKLARGLSAPEVATRADAVNALGRVGRRSAVATLLRGLADPASEVRTEAALGAGRTARAVRSRKEGTVAAESALETALDGAKETGEIRALLWAAAQLDTREGYDLVRTARDEHPDRRIRRFAEETLRNPRRSLVLPSR